MREKERKREGMWSTCFFWMEGIIIIVNWKRCTCASGGTDDCSVCVREKKSVVASKEWEKSGKCEVDSKSLRCLARNRETQNSSHFFLLLFLHFLWKVERSHKREQWDALEHIWEWNKSVWVLIDFYVRDFVLNFIRLTFVDVKRMFFIIITSPLSIWFGVHTLHNNEWTTRDMQWKMSTRFTYLLLLKLPRNTTNNAVWLSSLHRVDLSESEQGNREY